MNSKITRKEFLRLVGLGVLSVIPLVRRMLSITTDPSVLTTIDVTPTNVNLVVGEGKLFTATGKDQYDNPYPISNPVWSRSGGGTISPSGTTCMYTAIAPGYFTITCGQDGTTILDSAEITTTNPSTQLTTIDVTPTNVNLVVGEARLFTATGKDQYGNVYPVSNPVWSSSGGGKISPSGTTCTYTAEEKGFYAITCHQDGTGIQGTANISTGHHIYLPLVTRE